MMYPILEFVSQYPFYSILITLTLTCMVLSYLLYGYIMEMLQR